jgi:phosphoglycolate phosphatase-like HAD superfamily hydrolase
MATLALGGVSCAFEIVFMDCDGVIFDVNAHKVRAFSEALARYPEPARNELVAFHREHGGMSRYDKFRHFFREIHPVDDQEQAMAEALERFGVISERGYQELEPRSEALVFSDRMGGNVHVVSGADEVELRRVFDVKGIRNRFASVLGSPCSKRKHMATVLYERFCPANHALMVGDGRSDFEAAQALGVPFVFLREMSLWASADAALRDAPDAFIAESWSELLSWAQ